MKRELEIIKAILSTRGYVEVLDRNNLHLSVRHFADPKSKILFQEIERNGNNTMMLKYNTVLQNNKIDIETMFKYINNVDLVTEVNNLISNYNKQAIETIFRNNKSIPDINIQVKNLTSELYDLGLKETSNSYNLTEFIEKKMIEDYTRTSEIVGYRMNRMFEIERVLGGLQSGLTIIGGRSNSGKSTLLNNWIIDLLESNKDVFVLAFSLDDTIKETLNTMQSILSSGGLSRTDCKTPNLLGYIDGERVQRAVFKFGKSIMKNADTMYLESSEALKDFADDRLKIFDMETIQSFHQLEDMLKHKINKHRNKKLVVTLDGMLNLDVSKNSIHGDVNSEHTLRANLLKQLADIYDIPLIVTTELRKNNTQTMRFQEPTKDQILYTSKYNYNAKAIFLISHNDEHGLENNLVANKLIVAKNKFTEKKKPMFYRFFRKQGYCIIDNNSEVESMYKKSIGEKDV